MKHRAPYIAVAAGLALTLMGSVACTTQQVSSSSSSSGMTAAPGLGPVLTIERFLQAANTEDLATMASLFGTHDGPIGGRREDVELRMSAIASIVQHDDYEIGEQSREPGRTYPTQRVNVTLVQGSRRSEDVPFLVVETGNGAWLIEEIALEQITSR